MAIGDGGLGLGLSVDIHANLTGFEALTSIRRQLEELQEAAAKTEASFAQMGAALRQSMNMGTSEMNRAAEQMERVSRTAAGTRRRSVDDMEFVQGVDRVSPDVLLNSRVRSGLDRQEQRETKGIYQGENAVWGVDPVQRGFEAEQIARDRSTKKIRDEVAARDSLRESVGSMMMGGLGIAAAFEASKLIHDGVRASAELDQRIAAMRGSGFNNNEIETILKQAAQYKCSEYESYRKNILRTRDRIDDWAAGCNA